MSGNRKKSKLQTISESSQLPDFYLCSLVYLIMHSVLFDHASCTIWSCIVYYGSCYKYVSCGQGVRASPPGNLYRSFITLYFSQTWFANPSTQTMDWNEWIVAARTNAKIGGVICSRGKENLTIPYLYSPVVTSPSNPQANFLIPQSDPNFKKP